MQGWYGLGRIGREPEKKTTQGGTTLTKFSLAIDEYNPSTKEKEATWLEVVCFGKTADFVAQYFHKGDPIFIRQGRVSVNQWVDDDQNKRTSYNIIANQVDFVPGSSKGGQQGGGNQSQQQEPRQSSVNWDVDETEDPFGEE